MSADQTHILFVEDDEVDQLARSAVVDARGFGISDDVLRRVFRGLASKHFQL